MINQKHMTPKNRLCELIINCPQTDRVHAKPTKINKQVGNLSQLKYSQKIQGEAEVAILSSFSLSPGFHTLTVVEGDKITEAIILVP